MTIITSRGAHINRAIMALLCTHSIGNPPQNLMVVFKMRDSVPSARYSPVCNVLRQWKTSLTLIYSLSLSIWTPVVIWTPVLNLLWCLDPLEAYRPPSRANCSGCNTVQNQFKMEERSARMESADECRSQTAEDRDLKRSEQRADIDRDNDEHQEADNILDYAIEYCMTGSYPPERMVECTTCK